MRRFLLPFVLVSGCYTYAPLDATAIRPGLEVRARVSAPTATQIAPLLGVSDARLLAGTVIDAGADTMIVEVPTSVLGEVGNTLQTLHQRVSVPRSAVLELETRKVDRLRTGALVGGVTLGVAAIVVKAMKNNRGKEAIPGGGGPGEIRIPISWSSRTRIARVGIYFPFHVTRQGQ